jgi:hypothetical protein
LTPLIFLLTGFNRFPKIDSDPHSCHVDLSRKRHKSHNPRNAGALINGVVSTGVNDLPKGLAERAYLSIFGGLLSISFFLGMDVLIGPTADTANQINP